MSSTTDLNIARKNISDVLGDSMSLYLQNLNAWFKKKKDKEEFDYDARKLLRSDTIHLHNEFLLALIAKCQSLSTSLVSRESSSSGKSQKGSKLKRRPPGGRGNLQRTRPNASLKSCESGKIDKQQRFTPARSVDFVPQITSKALDEDATPTPLGFVSREGLMPDSAMIHGRMLVCAWESGLADVQDSAVQLILIALENQLKNILSLVIRQRKGFKLREHRFTYAAGIGVKNPYSVQSHRVSDTSLESEATTITSNFHHAPALRPSMEIGEEMAAQQDALGWATAPDEDDFNPISLFDVRDTLHLYKNSISSHSVYAPTVERVIHSMWHPSQDELDQDCIHQQESNLRHKLARRQTSVEDIIT